MVEVEAILPDTFVPDTSTAVAAAPPPVRVPARAVVPTVATPAPPTEVDSGGAPAPGSVFLQLGAFGVRENAERFLARMQADLAEVGAGLRIVTVDALHRVQAGPFAGRDEARRAADRIGALLGAVPVMVPR
ncbi:MAG: SPOR domain-containing protein [Alphaproteobacteria bacterium]|nr:SPOR domain-containing protein [Alphaproteobacteria bacterium]